MRVFVAGITPEVQYVRGFRSFRNIILRLGDVRDEFSSGRGDVSRRKACDAFLTSECDALLLCDLDMWHPSDELERLRSHDKDMVTGHYFARESVPLHSVIGQYSDKWPYLPMQDIPIAGLHRIGLTGMGCVLIKRAVIEAVQTHLPPGDDAFAIGPAPEVTGDYRSLGSDYRFFSVAQQCLGFELWLDAGVQCEHATVFWTDRTLYEALRHHQLPERMEREFAYQALRMGERGMDIQTLEARIKLLDERIRDYEQQKASFEQSKNLLEKQLIALNAVRSEDQFLINQIKEQTERFPTIPEEEREKFVQGIKGVEGYSKEEAQLAREKQYQGEAREFVDELDKRRTA